ncbi:GLPGLI family protein [Flavobacterium tegetincola]|uniref:GLPGLI family protein n=1 Tax=Flavobacterium tegetincola TaxID=150172 RepID=UPI0004219BA6|nr:GLPGLI family protein [Flavobacterium tegetincola]
MKIIITLLSFLLFITANAQKKSNAVQVTYEKSSNGIVLENQDPIVIYTDKNQTIVTSLKIIEKQATFPFETYYLARADNRWYQTAQLKINKTISTVDSSSISSQKLTLTNETKKILGYICKKATTSINSNSIDIWYTEALDLKGAPSSLGQNLGLVLEVTRNGNYSIVATKLQKLKLVPTNLVPNLKLINTTDVLSYRDELWQSRFRTLAIFENEVINFSDQSVSNDSIFRYAAGTLIIKKIKVGKIANGSQVFIDLKEQSNGDAYDRTGSVFIIPTDTKISFVDALKSDKSVLPIYDNGNGKQYQGVVKTDDYSPVVELMRFFTPFGVHHFNYLKMKNKDWEESSFYRQDISDLSALFSDQELTIGVFIGNYDQGGHKVSLNLTIHEEKEVKARTKKVITLFNTLNIMEMAGQEYATMFNSDKGLEVQFTLTDDLLNARLRYITTGHGGWGNGDEFVPKKNTIFLNSKEAFSFTPWKTDCGSYRNYNPASGNFENGLSSSDYSRSNWCPGTTTNPLFIDLGDLKAGTHTMTIKIPQGENEGNSFSSWNVSGVLVGE